MAIAKGLLGRRNDLPVLIMGGLVILSLIGFAGYYYYDRYVHADEKILDREAEHIEAMVRQNPQNAELRVAIATFYVDKGQTDLAIQQCQEALKIQDKNQGALLVLSRAYEKKGDVGNAIASLEKVVELNKDNELAKIDTGLEGVYFALGRLYDQQGQSDKAIVALKSALEIDGSDADARYLLGAIYQKQGDHAGAVREFQEALRFDPFFDKPYQGLAASYTALGRPDEAAYARGMVAFAKGQYPDAARQLEAVIAKSPDMVPAYFGLGISYENLGKRDEAKVALKRFLATNPDDMAANQAMTRLSQEVKP